MITENDLVTSTSKTEISDIDQFAWQQYNQAEGKKKHSFDLGRLPLSYAPLVAGTARPLHTSHSMTHARRQARRATGNRCTCATHSKTSLAREPGALARATVCNDHPIAAHTFFFSLDSSNRWANGVVKVGHIH